MTEYEKRSLEVLNAISDKLKSIDEKLSENWKISYIDGNTKDCHNELEEINSKLNDFLSK